MNNATGTNATAGAGNAALPSTDERMDKFFDEWDAKLKARFDDIFTQMEEVSGILRAKRKALANELRVRLETQGGTHE